MREVNAELRKVAWPSREEVINYSIVVLITLVVVFLIKDSSLVSVIAITDLTKSGREIITSTFATFEVWLVVAAMYLIVTSVLSQLVFYMERRFAVSD